MKPEAQRIAIAEACGFVTGASLGYTYNQASEFYRPDPMGRWRDLATWTKTYDWMRDFDPLNDLNAMHEAEKVLTNAQRRYYADMLVYCHPLKYDPRTPNKLYPDQSMDLYLIASMTAAQRAEAFLRTLGLWQDTKGEVKS